MEKYGFELLEERSLTETGGICRLWKFKKNGAQLLSICNKDENKCFGVNFYTPPVNSTGVAHILEHSVLCGSEKYPVKEPFVELLKGSLQTFLNAFTFPDKTCYPVASANLADFYNLVDVYLDAVFHPRITEDIFRQEGWHVDAPTADGQWSFRGVVYNEMKGVYSSPDSVLAEKSQQAMFPDNLYSLDSGGNPQHIPDLTWQEFKEFHQRYYQPGNARFFFWGDDPEEERLIIIAHAIEGYGPINPYPVVALQDSFSAPVTREIPFASSEGDERALFTVNWLLGERGDVYNAMLMEMLEHILEGLPGSPLRRALMESGLGEDTTGCGLETDLRQMYYSTGLKGIEPANVGKAEQLIFRTLQDLADNGIDSQAIEAALNTVEFAYRENNSGRFPRGLAAMIQALSTWLYDKDPLAPLAWEEPLARIKSALSRDEKIFEQAIKKNFLDNTSRAVVTLLPDSKLSEVISNAERVRIDAIQEQSSAQKREEYAAETEKLRNLQLAPDAPEDLAKIPALQVSDLPAKNAAIPREVQKISSQTFVYHDLPTSGIVYTTLLLPITELPERLIPYMPLLCRAFLEWGAGKRDYVQLGMVAAAKLGGLGVTTLTGIKAGSKDCFCYLSVSGKAVYDKIDNLFELTREILIEPQKNPDIILPRLTQMILEEKARLEYALPAAGHATAAARIRAHFRGAGAITEKMSGISQLEFIRSLASVIGKEPDRLLADLAELREHVIGAQNAVFDFVAEGNMREKIQKDAESLFAALPQEPALRSGQNIAAMKGLAELPDAEAYITPGQVNYVGKGANLYDLGYQFNGSANVITRWLRMGRLWEKVRVTGGAYGVFCGLDRLGGTFVCSSYRDPNVDETLSAYDGLGAYLREFMPTPAQLEQAIVGAVGELDAYLLPDAKAAKSLGWLLSGQTEEDLQKMREEMLQTTASDFKGFADILAAEAQEGVICVLGGEKTAQAAREHNWKAHKLI